jgi:1-acyl-sn-glycerol-3-phosphate acyltransferase
MAPGVDLGHLPLHDRRRRLLDRLLWLPVNLLQVVSFLLVCIILIPLALLVQRLTGDSRVALWMAHHWWGPIVVAGAMAKLRVRGLEFIESDKTYLVVANHQSYFDIPVLYSALPAPLHFLGLDYLAKLPGIGHFGKAVGTIYLSKASPFRAGKAALELVNYLREGRTTVIFPEGARSWDGQVKAFSPSLFNSAILAKTEILPLAIVNSRSVMPRGGGFLFRPACVEVRIGRPIPTRDLETSDRNALAQATWDQINTLLVGDESRRDEISVATNTRCGK